MKICGHCGNEQKDEAAFCPNCGCPTGVADAPRPKHTISKKTIILSCISVILLLITIFMAAVMIQNDVKLDDLTKKPNRITALIKFGKPRDLFDKEWIYDGISFHGIEVDYFFIDFKENTYTIMEYDEDDKKDLADLLVDECDYKKDALGLYYYFSYENADITAQNDCNYITIEP